MLRRISCGSNGTVLVRCSHRGVCARRLDQHDQRDERGGVEEARVGVRRGVEDVWPQATHVTGELDERDQEPEVVAGLEQEARARVAEHRTEHEGQPLPGRIAAIQGQDRRQREHRDVGEEHADEQAEVDGGDRRQALAADRRIHADHVRAGLPRDVDQRSADAAGVASGTLMGALLAARDKLYISWVGRDVRDNSVQPASILVSQLQDYLRAGWNIDPAALEAIRALKSEGMDVRALQDYYAAAAAQ